MFLIEVRRLLELAEEKLNALSDDRLSWWPFAFLKPEAHLPLTASRVLALAVLYAVPASLIAVLMGHGAGDHLSARSLARVILASTATFFVLFQSSFALVWNRRARRLEARRIQIEKVRSSVCAARE